MTESLEKKVVFGLCWEESERGWGPRPDGCSLHLTQEDRTEFVREYWASMPKQVPNEYSRPCEGQYAATVSADLYEKIKETRKGLRLGSWKERELMGMGELRIIGKPDNVWVHSDLPNAYTV